MFVSVVYCQVKISALGCSLVKGSPAELGVSECDREASTVRRSWPTGGCRAIKKTRYCQNTLCSNDAWWCGPDTTVFE